MWYRVKRTLLSKKFNIYIHNRNKEKYLEEKKNKENNNDTGSTTKNI